MFSPFGFASSALVQAVTRLQTYHSNLDAVLGFYKDVTVRVRVQPTLNVAP
jgi:hypothetical protein